jgi:hypothetical protein
VVSGGRFDNLRSELRSAPRAYAPGDYAEVCKWYVGHREAAPRAEWLPATGRIVPQVAAGFLYRTDSSLGFIDGFVSNPRAAPTEVKAALEAILKGLEADAKRLGMTVIVGNTKHAGVAELARALGGVIDKESYLVIGKVV